MPSQVILNGTVNYGRNLKSIVTKLLIQICSKIGGVPWTCDQLSPLVNEAPTMVCGVNVYYDSDRTGCSGVVGLVATTNKKCTRYYSAYEVLNTEWPGTVAYGIDKLMAKAIKNFTAINGARPERIVVYREGIQAHIENVCAQEVALLKPICDEAKLIYVHVEQRLLTEMYA